MEREIDQNNIRPVANHVEQPSGESEARSVKVVAGSIVSGDVGKKMSTEGLEGEGDGKNKGEDGMIVKRKEKLGVVEVVGRNNNFGIEMTD